MDGSPEKWQSFLAASIVVAAGCGSSTTVSTTRVGCAECTVLTGANVFDGVNAGPGTVVVRGQRIEQLHRRAVEVVAGHVVDLPGRTILPGLIDLHVHIRPSAGPPSMSDAGNEQEAHFKAFLRHGVTTVLDLGMEPHVIFEHRRRIRHGDVVAPSLLASGSVFTPSGGHPCYQGRPSFGYCAFVDDATSAREAMDELMDSHPDVIKVVIESGTAKTPLPEIGAEALAAIGAAAEVAHVPVAAHVAESADMAKALDAGVHIFAHLPVHDTIDADLAQRLLSEGAVVIPTAAVVDARYRVAHEKLDEVLATDASRDIPRLVLEAWNDPSRTTEMRTEEARAESARRRTNVLENIRFCREAGIPIAAGTDAGNPATFHGLSLRRELALYVEAGMSPREALMSASSRAADVLGLRDRGRIANNARADLVVVEGDPTKDLGALARVEQVYLLGERLALDELAVDHPSSLTRTSIAGLREGAVCLEEGECADGLLCTSFNRCRSPCTSLEPCTSGQACFEIDKQTGVSYCDPGDGCDPLGQDCPNEVSCIWLGAGVTRCWYPGKGAAGQTCASWGTCSPGHQCDATSQMCVRLCDPTASAPGCPVGTSCVDRSEQAGITLGECR